MTEFEGTGAGGFECAEEPDGALMGIGTAGAADAARGARGAARASVQRMKGLVGAAGGLLTVLHLAIDYFRRH